MPVKPNAAVLGSLFAACRIHINVDLAEYVAECLFELDPENETTYTENAEKNPKKYGKWTSYGIIFRCKS